MPKTRVVKQGEHASRIAAEEGFRDFLTIWDDPANGLLRERRTNPHILFPGDEVVIPDRKTDGVDVAVAKRHRFETVLAALKLRLGFLDYHQRPLAGVDIKLQIEGRKVTLPADGGGLVELDVAPSAEIGTAEALGLEFALRIGHLDPVEEESGQAARLTNLGYFVTLDAESDPDELRSAIEEFQLEQKIKVTGEFDDATKAKMLSVHGS